MMGRPACLTILQERNVRLYLGGQLVSLSGTWMQSVAQGWMIYSLTHSPFWLALSAVALTAPVSLLALMGGAQADRGDRRRLLIITQAVALLPALLLGILTQNGMITAPGIVVLSLMTGTVNAFDLPARQALWGSLVRPECLLSALSLNAVVFNATRIMGPLLAGSIIAAWGTATCFYLNAASFVVGIGTLLAMGHAADTSLSKAKGTRNSYRDELYDGLRYVAAEKDIARIIVLVAILSVFGIPFVPLLPFFADGILHVGPQGLGMLGSSSGAGALAAAVVIALRGELPNKGRLLVAAGLVFAVCLLVFARSQAYFASLLALLFIGAGIVLLLALTSCLLQRRCPDVLRGRVMGIYTLVLIGMAPFGHFLMGLLTTTVGAARALSVCSTICLTAVLVMARPISRMV